MANSFSETARLLADIPAMGLTISIVDDRLRLAGSKKACAIVAPRVAAAKRELLDALRGPETLAAYAERTLPRIEDISHCLGGGHYAAGHPCEICISIQAALDALPPLPQTRTHHHPRPA